LMRRSKGDTQCHLKRFSPLACPSCRTTAWARRFEELLVRRIGWINHTHPSSFSV